MSSFSTLDVKMQRALSIACVRDEIKKGNLVLNPGGIRSQTEGVKLCVVALKEKLHGLGFRDYGDLLGSSSKHALHSVLKTEGRKSENKQIAYKLMIENSKSRVQRWRLSARLLSALIPDQVLRGVSAEERAKQEQVSLLVTDFWFSLMHLLVYFRRL
jgi:hypothetical protein